MSEVLVVDDQVPLLDALGESLRGRGYDVEFATNGGQALALIRQHVADAVILDLDLPDVGGMEVLNSIRDWTAVPVIALSTRTAEIQKVAALDAGADDYITKPFDMDELMARLRVVLRGRRCGTCEPVITTEHFTIDLAARQVARDGRTVPLTRTEWEIVALLARHPGCLISQQL
jgi:two-component system KDP operon response regulator KdpE